MGVPAVGCGVQPQVQPAEVLSCPKDCLSADGHRPVAHRVVVEVGDRDDQARALGPMAEVKSV